tara:strand:- start:4374 stop:4586 length:213 start_codon:yes stop_codon:yes gene_type:complete
MIYKETLIGYTRPINMVGVLIDGKNTDEVLQMGDKNPSKPPKKKQKKEKKSLEEFPLKKKRKKPRLKQTA